MKNVHACIQEINMCLPFDVNDSVLCRNKFMLVQYSIKWMLILNAVWFYNKQSLTIRYCPGKQLIFEFIQLNDTIIIVIKYIIK